MHPSFLPSLLCSSYSYTSYGSRPANQSSPFHPAPSASVSDWTGKVVGGFSQPFSLALFLIDSMWQLHGRLQSHPFSPRGRSRSLAPQFYLTSLFPSDRSAPPVQEVYETLGTFIFKQTLCSIQILSTALPCLQRGTECLGFYRLTSSCTCRYACVSSMRLSVLTGEGQTLDFFAPACVVQHWKHLQLKVEWVVLRLGVHPIYFSVCDCWCVTDIEGREEADCWQDFCLVVKTSNMLHVMCKCVFLSEQ